MRHPRGSRRRGARRGIKYISYYGTLGYYAAAKRCILALKHAGVPVTWTPMVASGPLDKKLQPYLAKEIGDPDLDPACNHEIDYDTVILHLPPDLYPMWIDREPNKKILGYTVWETDKLPRHWPALLNRVDVVLVPCRWNKQVFAECGVTRPIEVIPHIAPDSTPTDPGPLWDLRPDDFVFYTIETWTARKAVWNTIRCYLDTFRMADRVLLAIKTTQSAYSEPFIRRNSLARYVKGLLNKLPATPRPVLPAPTAAQLLHRIQRTYRSPARTRLITRELTDDEILGLHYRGDCYVSLSRAEGWGFGAFDAASFARPVIITGFGGQLDYLPKESAFLIDYDLIPVRNLSDVGSFTPDQRWADARVAHASRMMRYVYENREDAKRKGEALRSYIRRTFCREKVVMKLLGVLEQA